MKSRLPATPLAALSISGLLRLVVKTIHTGADVFRFWKYPRLKAAADFENMSLMDKMYWGYKSKNPIRYGEKGGRLEAFFANHPSALSLPGEFRPSRTVSLAAVGDLIKVDGLENSQDFLYEKIAGLIFDKDISYGNLESQLSAGRAGAYTFSEKETPPLCCTLEQYQALKGHQGKNFTILATACNHTLDMGIEGLDTTLAQLEKDQILDLGTNRTPDEKGKGSILDINGIRVGFVSATYGLNGKPVPEGKEYVVNVVKIHPQKDGETIDLTLLEEQIAFCRGQGCDIVIASLHWGYEYEFFPRRCQIDIAHELVEMGVDLILSHHAHVIQPIEFYQTERDPVKIVPIIYSLGNLTTSFSAPQLVLSTVLNLDIVKGMLDGEEKTFINNVRLHPVVQTEIERGGLPAFRLELLADFIAANKGNEDSAGYIAALTDYANLVLEADRR